MKLSAAVENALVTGDYGNWRNGHYMCIALSGQPAHIKKVQELVDSIHKAPYAGYPLACALHKAGYVDGSFDGIEAYTTQLYVWWVYDLKRKGL